MSQKSRTFAIVIEIERHIEILLLNNDCVIVPNLGGFMTHHIEARYDADSQMFLPPQRTLGFNPQLKLNDSLLAQSYIEAYDISYPEAIRRIESEVNELKQHLDNEGSYELNDLGVLSINSNGKLEFEPCEAGILTPELYGLSSFEMLPLGTVQETTTEPAATVAEADDMEPAKEPAEAMLTVATEEVTPMEPDDDKDRQAIIIKMSWIRNTVAIAAAVILFFILTTPVSNDSATSVSKSQMTLPVTIKDTSIKAPAEPTPEKVKEALQQQQASGTVNADTTTVAAPEDHAATASATAATQENTTTTAPAEEPAADVKPQQEQPAAKQPASYYCIVLASQVSAPNANEFVGKLQKKGLSDARVYINNNIRRVICGQYASSDEAHAALGKIHQMAGLAEAWVYQVKE